MILPWLSKGYSGQSAILKHLSVLIRWAEQQQEELPALLITGARGQGQTVLAELIARNCELEYVHIGLTNTATIAYELRALPQIEDRKLLYIECQETISPERWAEVVLQLKQRNQSHLARPTELSDLIVRARHATDLPTSVRFLMGAHFHFGPNEDEGELALQRQLAEEKGYAFAPDALRKIVGGSDALGERLLDLS